jgi:hypothetical protein
VSVDGALFNKSQSLLIRYPAGKAQGGYIIPNMVTNIRDFAFEGCKALTSVTIPNNVSSIGVYAFSGCSQLRSAYFEGNEPRTEQNSWASEETFASSEKATVYYNAGTTGWVSTFERRPTVLWIPGADLDHDGLSNSQEKFAGTDPIDGMSLLVFESVPRPNDLAVEDKTGVGPDQIALYFQTVAGRTYQLEFATSLVKGWNSVSTLTAWTTQKRAVLNKPASAGFYRVLVLSAQ